MKLARKAGLISTGNIAVAYTGAMTDEVVTMSGVTYRLLTLTTSGTLTLSAPVKGEVCVVGGGSSGQLGNRGGVGGRGGGGAFMITQTVNRLTGGAAVIGAGGARNGSHTIDFNAGGITSFAGVSSGSVTSNSGGSGGGGGAGPAQKPGTGDGLTKYPFGDSTYFSHPHCAGGGGGAQENLGDEFYWSGGAGGTNGGNGSVGTSATEYTYTGGAGGNYGGGKGQSGVGTDARKGTDATYYGSAGGGGFYFNTSSGRTDGTDGGAGYQGIIYIRIPLNQSA